jgi:hypothetical protein
MSGAVSAALLFEPKMTNRQPIIVPPALQPLTKEKRWVGWRFVVGKDGKRTKPPFRADEPSKYASNTDPSTWCDFDTAMRSYIEERCDGIGFALSDSDISCSLVVAFDIDDCRDASAGTLHPWAEDLVRCSGSYAEVTRPQATTARQERRQQGQARPRICGHPAAPQRRGGASIVNSTSAGHRAHRAHRGGRSVTKRRRRN